MTGSLNDLPERPLRVTKAFSDVQLRLAVLNNAKSEVALRSIL